MAYCKKFIAGVSAINFSESSAQLIKFALLSYSYDELKKELEAIKDRLARLPEEIKDNPYANSQLQLYKEKQAETIERINAQLGELVGMAQGLPGFLKDEIVINEDFIHEFSKNFRNIKHLADVLSDAPAVIKQQQTRLYTEILFKLDPLEQEAQLQTLSLDDISDMIKQALLIYENQSDIHLRNQAQRLVQMGIYEIIRSQSAKALFSESFSPYLQYKSFIETLNFKIPKVGQSDILDNFSEYRSISSDKTIADLLSDVESKCKINPNEAWTDKIGGEVFAEKRSLLHSLRFGQEDRREYAKMVQNNLTRDLFWGRSIRDIELFTKRGVSDEVFAALVQQNFINNSQVVEKPENKLPEFQVQERRLATAIAAIKTQCKADGVKLGNATQVKDDHLKKMRKIVGDKVKDTFSTPTVKIENGLIVVDLYHATIEEERFTNAILKAGGLTSAEKGILLELRKAENGLEMQVLTLKGKTLSEIEKQIPPQKIFPTDPVRDAYISQLEKLKVAFNDDKEVTIKGIKDLKLDESEEILLRKLLELRVIAPLKGVTNSIELADAFSKMKAGAFKDAIKIKDLETVVDKAYENLAALKEESIQEKVKPIWQKAKTLHSKERAQKIQVLDELFNSDESYETKVVNLSRIFIEEYKEMADTLGLSKEDYLRLAQDVRAMAEEAVRLLEYTQQGKSALTIEEQTAYFNIIHQIAMAIRPAQMMDMTFKIPHSLHSGDKLTVTDKEGKQTEVPIQLKGVKKLPYSLIKRPGENEFIFSYGGSRGVIAPFAGLDEAYAGKGKKKGRLFTHSRLLGVGQYGTVKEVESLLTGLNQVLKKGYVEDTEPTFTEASRNELKTRPITARNDPYYRIESDILQNLSKAEKNAKGSVTGGTQYWIETDKKRHKGALYSKDNAPQQYQILSTRAKGETFSGTANKAFNLYSKDNLSYHNPEQRKKSEVAPLGDMLALAQALVTEAEKFSTLGSSEKYSGLGFAHNDIKPENFLYKRNADGSFQVKYIDWATGGFKQKYNGNEQKKLGEIFAELFGDIRFEEKDGVCFDTQGRFVKKEEGLGIVYGINPSLQILHGVRNGTLPYISPNRVLGLERKRESVAPKVPGLDTILNDKESSLDDWALTAMTFGVCNLQAYFALVKGRAVVDYIVPGILEADGKTPLGLTIVSVKKFNEFFACDNPLDADSEQSGAVYTNPNLVMFIPSNQREGEPLHLYRRLKKLKETLSDRAQGRVSESLEQRLIHEIDQILTTVHKAIATGEGLSKQSLQEQLSAAQHCLKSYEKLNETHHKEDLLRKDALQTAFDELKGVDKLNANNLLKITPNGLSYLQILSIYPTTKTQKDEVITLFEKVFDETEINDKFLGSTAPGRNLFKECIAHQQSEILISLLEKIKGKNEDFVQLVKDDWLLHYAAEQGMTGVFSHLISALRGAGASDEDIFKLSLAEYRPSSKSTQSVSHLKWTTNCFHIAIRNNNKKQLEALLTLLPAGNTYDQAISEALHLCAVLANKELFNDIVRRYNTVNLQNQLTAKDILAMTFPPDELSPFHLFLGDEAALSVLDNWPALKEPELARQFLLSPANPALIAAAKGNFAAISYLVELGSGNLSVAEWQQFFSQTDAQGKNILNYILELERLEYLDQFINLMEKTDDTAEILVKLLSNPDPVNPIRNFLNKEANISHQQFQTFQKLLDAICPKHDKATTKQQQARIVALLVNKNWLIEQAKDSINHESLYVLLQQNDALSIPFKQVLFKTLKEAAGSSVASQFYGELLAQVSLATQTPDKKTQLEISRLFGEVIRQTADFDILFSALAKDHQVAKELEGLTTKLRSEVEIYKQEVEEVTAEIASQKKAIEQVEVELSSTKQSLVQAEARSSELSDQIKEVISARDKEFQRLEKQVELARKEGLGGVEAAENTLAEARKVYEAELASLNKTLQSEQEETARLTRQLQEKATKLEEQDKQFSSLTERFNALDETRERLEEELSTTTQLGAQERLEFEQALKEETSKRESKEAELHELSEQLQELSEVNASLKKGTEELESKNKSLEEQVGTLRDEMKEYQQEIETTKQKLVEEERKSKEAANELSKVKDTAASAQKEAEAMRLEAERLREEMKLLREEMQNRETQLKKREEAVVLNERRIEELAQQMEEQAQQVEERIQQVAEREEAVRRDEEALQRRAAIPPHEVVVPIETPRQMAQRKAIIALKQKLR